MKQIVTFVTVLVLTFISFVPSVFAANVMVTGKVDNMDANTSGSKIVFKDSTTHQEVVSKTLDPLGNYAVQVPEGTYDIAIVGASGKEISALTKNKQITTNTISNFALPSTTPPINNTGSNQRLFIAVAILLILFVIGVGYLIVKRK